MKIFYTTLLLFIISIIHAQQGLEVYIPKSSYAPTDDCMDCFYPTEQDLPDKPILTSEDIKYFSNNLDTLYIGERGSKKLNKLIDKSVSRGRNLVVTIDRKPIFGFILYNKFCSLGCDWLVAFQYGKRLEFCFGLPRPKPGLADPRTDKRLLEYVAGKR